MILFLLVGTLFGGSFRRNIVSLSSTDNNFVFLQKLIASNKSYWLDIKSHFSITQIKNIKPLSVFSYKVQSNDTIFSIAEQFGLNSDTIISFNALANSASLLAGDTILLPSMDGVIIFPAARTQTDTIAHIYNIPEELLLYVNGIQHGVILPKEEIFVPFAKMSDQEKSYFLFHPFSFPLDSGRFSSNYGMRFHPIAKRWIFHGGVDIATPSSSRVYSCADGTVIYAGPAKGYGNLIIVKHEFGYTSWYGHLSVIKVAKGNIVKNHDMIALSGSTGISTGPHLHFEVRRFNLRENPMEVLTFNHQATEYNPTTQGSDTGHAPLDQEDASDNDQ